MGFLQNVINRFSSETRGNPAENPSVSLSSPAVWSWITGSEPTASGELIDERKALQISTVYVCVRIIAETIASLPAKVFETLPAGRREAVDADLYDLLTLNPNPEMTAFSFFETLSGSLCLTGNCYAQIQRVGGKVVALWPLHPLMTHPIRKPGGGLAYSTTDGMQPGQTRVIEAADCIAIPLFSFDGVLGLSPIAMARQMLGLAVATTKYGARFFGNGSKPGGLLSTSSNLNDVQLSAIKESWQAAQGGVNQGKTAVLHGDWKYSQIGISPEDSQFLATKAFNRTQIAALFQVPGHLCGDTSRLSNSNHEQQQLQFLTGCIRPYLVRMEQELKRKLLPALGRNAGRFHIQFDTRELTRGDFASQMTAYAVGRTNGFLNANDIRQSLGDNPIPGLAGSCYWMPVNMQDANFPNQGGGNAPEPEDDPEDTDPLAGDDSGDNTADPLTDDQRSLPAAAAFVKLFRDGMGRLLSRDKRDYEAISHIFTPLVDTLATLAEAKYGAVEADVRAKLLKEALKGLEKRSGAWLLETADEFADAELTKLTRAVVINIAKEAAAKKALSDGGSV